MLDSIYKFLISYDLIKIITPYLIDIIYILFSVIVTFLITMMIVYTLGRSFKILNTDNTKNGAAYIVMIISSYLFATRLNFIYSKEIFIFNIIILSLSVLAYVLIGFTLYSRVDSFFDNKFAKDKPRKIKRSPRRGKE